MKRFGIIITQLILVITLLISNSTIIIYAEETYTDQEIGISFTIPSGWKAIGLSKEDREVAKERFSTDNGTDILVYMSADMYERAKSQGINIKKEEFVGYRITIDEAKEMMKDYNFEKTYSRYVEGVNWCVLENSLFTTYIQVINGYMIGFMYSNLMNNERVNQVKDIIKEVSINVLEKEKQTTGGTGSGITGSSSQQKPNNQTIEQETKTLMIHGLIWVVLGAFYLWYRNNRDIQIKCANCGGYNNKENKHCVKCGNKLR